MKKVCAFVPLKATSQRIPDKNIVQFAGQPLYHHLLDKLQRSELVSSILINTDSLIIAEEAADLFPKAEIIIRPPHLEDRSLDEIAVYDCGKTPEEDIIQILCTFPLISLKTIEAAIRFYFSFPEPRSIHSVQRIHGKVINEKTGNSFGEMDEPLLHFNWLFLFRKNLFLNSGGNRFTMTSEFYEMDKGEGFSVEYPDDLEISEFLMTGK